MVYGHRYPWQLVTRLHRIDLACRLSTEFDAEELRRELDGLLRDFTPRIQHGQYHEGGWRAIGLVAVNGDYTEDRPVSASLPGTYLPTAALEKAPYMRSIIESFPAPRQRVRLMQMAPGTQIFWHYDTSESLDAQNVRLHVPIVTSTDVFFQISHQDLHWKSGTLWYGDFSFPHRVWNRGETARVHLVIDLEVNDAIRDLFPESFRAQQRARAAARRWCELSYSLVYPSYLRHYLATRVPALRGARSFARKLLRPRSQSESP